MAVESHTLPEGSNRPRWMIHLLLIVCCIAVALPMIFAIIKSSQDSSQVLKYPPDFTLGSSMLTNYSDALTKYNVARYMINSTVVALVVTAGKKMVSFLAARGVVFFCFPPQNTLFALFFVALPIPIDILILGVFFL